ncbi:hypothetical protein [Comamonas sediminis]|uniref:Minor tail protein n=1 Tax=Comamonas sediminis TaxID=1783360 RepID=A0ABV4B7K0_9BURK
MAARYWRLVGLQVPTGMSVAVLQSLKAFDATGAELTAMVSASVPPTSGSPSALPASWSRQDFVASGFAIHLDMGVSVNIARVSVQLQGLSFSTFGSLQQLNSGAWEHVLRVGEDPYFDNVGLLWIAQDWLDRSPKAFEMMRGGAPELVKTGKWGSAAKFMGGSYLNLPASNALSPDTGGKLTFEAWATCDVGSDRANALISVFCGSFESSDRCYQINLSVAAGTVTAQIVVWGGFGSSNVVGNLSQTVTGDVTTEIYIGASFDGLQLTWCVNGSLMTTTMTGSPISGPGVTCIARDPTREPQGFDRDYKGIIGAMRITKGVARDLSSVPLAPWRSGVHDFPAHQLARTSALSGQVAPVGMHRLHGTSVAKDCEFGGPGRIWGTNEIETSPNSRMPTGGRVVLLRQRDKILVRETWADAATGAWEFKGIDPLPEYLVLAEDLEGNYRPVAANKLTPEVA